MLKLYLKISLAKLTTENKCRNTENPENPESNGVVIPRYCGTYSFPRLWALSPTSTPTLRNWPVKEDYLGSGPNLRAQDLQGGGRLPQQTAASTFFFGRAVIASPSPAAAVVSLATGARSARKGGRCWLSGSAILCRPCSAAVRN